MNETKKGFVQLHLSVLLAGFTGLFGRLITLNEVDIVWYRMLFTSMILLVFTGLPRVGWRKFMQLCGCGALLGFHWILYCWYVSFADSGIEAPLRFYSQSDVQPRTLLYDHPCLPHLR